MFSNLSQASGTAYVFCYDMVTILHAENVEYMYFFNSFYPHPLKFLPPDTILYLALPRELSQNNQLFYFCRIITKDFTWQQSLYIG